MDRLSERFYLTQYLSWFIVHGIYFQTNGIYHGYGHSIRIDVPHLDLVMNTYPHIAKEFKNVLSHRHQYRKNPLHLSKKNDNFIVEMHRVYFPNERCPICGYKEA